MKKQKNNFDWINLFSVEVQLELAEYAKKIKKIKALQTKAKKDLKRICDKYFKL